MAEPLQNEVERLAEACRIATRHTGNGSYLCRAGHFESEAEWHKFAAALLPHLATLERLSPPEDVLGVQHKPLAEAFSGFEMLRKHFAPKDVEKRARELLAKALERVGEHLAARRVRDDREAGYVASDAAIEALTTALSSSRADALEEMLRKLREGMAQSVWHNITGGRAKRIFVAESAIKRIDALISTSQEQAR